MTFPFQLSRRSSSKPSLSLSTPALLAVAVDELCHFCTSCGHVATSDVIACTSCRALPDSKLDYDGSSVASLSTSESLSVSLSTVAVMSVMCCCSRNGRWNRKPGWVFLRFLTQIPDTRIPHTRARHCARSPDHAKKRDTAYQTRTARQKLELKTPTRRSQGQPRDRAWHRVAWARLNSRHNHPGARRNGDRERPPLAWLWGFAIRHSLEDLRAQLRWIPRTVEALKRDSMSRSIACIIFPTCAPLKLASGFLAGSDEGELRKGGRPTTGGKHNTQGSTQQEAVTRRMVSQSVTVRRSKILSRKEQRHKHQQAGAGRKAPAPLRQDDGHDIGKEAPDLIADEGCRPSVGGAGPRGKNRAGWEAGPR